LRRKDKETLDMGKILEVSRSIHPALGDPWWAAGAISGSFLVLILVFLLFRRKREKNDDLVYSYSSDLVEPELTNENLPEIDQVSPELAPNEKPQSSDGAMFTEHVSEVRIREHDEHDEERAADAASDVNEEPVNATESTSSDERKDVMVEKVPEEVSESSEPTGFQTEPSDKNEDSEDDGLETISSKLDLSRAYIEMGDSVGARALLEDIIIEGDVDQKTESRELLIKIEMQPD
jgi:FimV-like protein